MLLPGGTDPGPELAPRPGTGLLFAGEGERLVEFPTTDGVGGKLGPCCWGPEWAERAEPWLERLALELLLTRNCSGLWPAAVSFSWANCSRVTVGEALAADCAPAPGAPDWGGAGADWGGACAVLVLLLVG